MSDAERIRTRSREAELDLARALRKHIQIAPVSPLEDDEASSKGTKEERFGSCDRSLSVSDVQHEIYVSHLARAEKRHTILSTVSIFIGVIGVVALLGGAIWALMSALNEGIFASIVGTIVTGIGGLVFRQAEAAEEAARANFKLLSESVNHTNRIRQAIDLAGLMSDEKQKQYLLSTIALSLIFENVGSSEEARPFHSVMDKRPDF